MHRTGESRRVAIPYRGVRRGGVGRRVVHVGADGRHDGKHPHHLQDVVEFHRVLVVVHLHDARGGRRRLAAGDARPVAPEREVERVLHGLLRRDEHGRPPARRGLRLARGPALRRAPARGAPRRRHVGRIRCHVSRRVSFVVHLHVTLRVGLPRALIHRRRRRSLGRLDRGLRRRADAAVQLADPRALARHGHAVQDAPLPDLALVGRRVAADVSAHPRLVGRAEVLGELRGLPRAAGCAVGADEILRVVHVLDHASESDQRAGLDRLDAHGVDLGNLRRRPRRRKGSDADDGRREGRRGRGSRTVSARVCFRAEPICVSVSPLFSSNRRARAARVVLMGGTDRRNVGGVRVADERKNGSGRATRIGRASEASRRRKPQHGRVGSRLPHPPDVVRLVCVSHLFEHPRLRERGLERRSDPPVGVQGVDPTGGADGGVEETRDRAERIADARRRLAHRHRARGVAAADLGEKWRETDARAAFAFPFRQLCFQNAGHHFSMMMTRSKKKPKVRSLTIIVSSFACCAKGGSGEARSLPPGASERSRRRSERGARSSERRPRVRAEEETGRSVERQNNQLSYFAASFILSIYTRQLALDARER